MIEVISRFNNGNGGVSIIIEREHKNGDTYLTGEFISPDKAVELGKLIITKAFNSRNLDVPIEVATLLEKLKVS